MRSGFKKFKRKIYRGVFTKSFLFSASAAFVLAAIILLLGKLNLIEDNLILALQVGGAALVLSFIVSYAVLFPGAARAARLVDEELLLGEKAQTMQAFRKERGEMVELQRRETEKLLRKLPVDWYSVKKIWVYALVFLLSFALCSFVYLMPDRVIPPEAPPPDEPFLLSEWQEVALENLIDYVENSELQDSAKASVAQELRTLLETLRVTYTVRQMKASVIGSIVEIGTVIDKTNSYDELAAVIDESTAVGMKELAAAIGTPDEPAPAEKFDALSAIFSDKSVAELSTVLLGIGAEVGIILTELELADDPLAEALDAFSDGAFDFVDAAGGYDETGAARAVEALLSSAKISFGAALAEMGKNTEVGDYTLTRLMEIFGITEDDLPPEAEDVVPDKPQSGDGEEPPKEEDENLGESGGFGSGDTVYGSDDVIYYPDEERYAAYGEVINEYYAKITEKILSGEISEELAASLEKYFASLYDGAARVDPDDLITCAKLDSVKIRRLVAPELRHLYR